MSAGDDAAKPVDTAKILYLPGARFANEYAPSLLVVAVLATPFASVSVTVAPTIVAPNSSLIEPRNVARFCAKTLIENATTKATHSIGVINFRIFIIHSSH